MLGGRHALLGALACNELQRSCGPDPPHLHASANHSVGTAGILTTQGACAPPTCDYNLGGPGQCSVRWASFTGAPGYLCSATLTQPDGTSECQTVVPEDHPEDYCLRNIVITVD